MNFCPKCSRPLELGEELCPSCKLKDDREKKEGFLWILATTPYLEEDDICKTLTYAARQAE